MTALLWRRYLAEYARRPLNLVLLAVVPVVFVILSAGAIADFARILGGPGNHTTLETATAGWAAALLAGVAGFFQVNSSLIVVFVWMFDLCLGPAMGGSSRVLTRVFPTHFPTLIMINVATHHAGPLGDLDASLVWTEDPSRAHAYDLIRVTIDGRRRACRPSRCPSNCVARDVRNRRHGRGGTVGPAERHWVEHVGLYGRSSWDSWSAGRVFELITCSLGG